MQEGGVRVESVYIDSFGLPLEKELKQREAITARRGGEEVSGKVVTYDIRQRRITGVNLRQDRALKERVGKLYTEMDID